MGRKKVEIKEEVTTNQVVSNDYEHGTLIWAVDMFVRGVNYASNFGVYSEEDIKTLNEALQIIINSDLA